MNDGGMRATFVKSSSWFRRQVSAGAKVGPATWVSVESNCLDFGFRNSFRVISNLSKSERRFFYVCRYAREVCHFNSRTL